MGEGLDSKTSNFLVYLIANMAIPTKTALIKMSYLCDLAAVKSKIPKITAFDYIRYYYGPYDKIIDDYLLKLVKAKTINAETQYSSNGGEYEKFSVVVDDEKLDEIKDAFSKEEIEIIDSILESLGSLNAKMLTAVAYKTDPMKSLNATLGGNENLGKKLVLA